jgi:hypothetical protein
VKQELPTLPEHMISSRFLVGFVFLATNKTDRHDITDSVESGVKHHKTKPINQPNFNI